jgi:hypothetical protein
MPPDIPERRPYAEGQPGYAAPQRVRPTVDARMLWSGGVATAVVAGLIALVGVLICRWLFNVPILAPRHDGAYGNAHTTTLILVSVLAALVATLLAHLLLLSTPRPMVFFGWIVALVTVVMVIFPFKTGASLAEKAATAALYLVIGVAIGSLITGVGERATRMRAVPSDPADRGYPGQGPNYPGGQAYPGQGQNYPGQGQNYPGGQGYPGRDY